MTVCCGIIGNCLLEPWKLHYRLNGDLYLILLENRLEEQMDGTRLNLRTNWFMHDEAPAHFQNQVSSYLNARFPQWWIGRTSGFLWPPRSPDLNLLDFFLWGLHEVDSRLSLHERNSG